MRQVLFAGLVAIGYLAIPITSSSAATHDQYCLQGQEWGYPGNCEFSTYRQCMATASGIGAYCGINPRYAFAHQQRGYPPAY